MQTAEGNRRQLRVVGEGLLPSAMGGGGVSEGRGFECGSVRRLVVAQVLVHV